MNSKRRAVLALLLSYKVVCPHKHIIRYAERMNFMEEYKGLCDAEAKESARKNGYNRITEQNKVSLWQKYKQNFNDPIIMILLAALGINVIFTFFGKVDWFECAGILAAVLIATFVSTISEYKNENTFRSLQKRALEILCKVYRNGSLCEISIEKIVSGDIVLLSAGDLIPADGYILSGNIKVDQSSLNGESREVEKTGKNRAFSSARRMVDFWDGESVYRGSVVTFGRAVMRVCAVGDATLYGRLTAEAQESETKSPLSIRLLRLAKDISRFGYVGAAMVFLLFMLQKGIVNNNFDPILISRYFSDTAQFVSDAIEGVIMCVTVIVVAVPEGLPLMIAIVCSLNMRKMLKSNVLVRKLVGIETAGSINILFTDKTGTLTRGNLCVTAFVDGDNCVYEKFSHIPKRLSETVFLSASLNTGATCSNGKIIGGNSTEKALLEYVKKGKSKLSVKKTDELLFCSENKYSTAVLSGDFCGTLVKGAPEIILPHCESFYSKEGEEKPFDTSAISRRADSFSKDTERVIALALSKEQSKYLPKRLIFLGLVIISDEIRPNVKAAVSEVNRAGIQVVMVTGDRAQTAEAIAKKCGIITSKSDLVLTSDELHMMGDTELCAKLPRIRVIARALPEDKSRLIRAAQKCKMVVGMTGDGVNDSPALKQADVGFAMGSGTEVAKEAGDIVITDDNFASIKKAVLYGRTIYKSIKKFVTFQLTINVAAVSVSVLGLVAGIEKPLSITQMLWINLVMDTLAAIAFGGEAALSRYMLEKPKDKDDAILDKKAWSAVVVDGLFICAISLFMFLSPEVRALFRSDAGNLCFYTGYFSFFVFASIFNAFNARAEGIDLLENLAGNKQFIYVMAAIAAVQVLMTLFGGSFLGTVPLNFKEWIVVLGFAFLIIPLDIIRKLVKK